MFPSLSLKLTSRQWERLSQGLRVMGVGAGGGIMACFADFAALLHVFTAPVLMFFFFGMGMLVGMMSMEIHHAIFSALLSMVLGAALFLSWLVILSYLILISVMGNVMLVMGVMALMSVLHIQLIGVLVGCIIGRV